MNDWAFFVSQDDGVRDAHGDLQDGTEIRRARLFASGRLHQTVSYKAQFDFASGTAAFKDVYIGVGSLPLVGNLRVGHFKEPLSLEIAGSSNHIPLIERSLASDLAPERNTGVMLHRHARGKRVTWACGVFRDTDAYGNDTGDGEYNVTGRLTGLPLYGDGGRMLTHVGIGYSYRTPPGGAVRYSARPEAHLAPRLVDTGTVPADAVNLLGAEALLILNAASVQSEFIASLVDRSDGTDAAFFGYYVVVSVAITGEHRAYSRSAASSQGITPKRSFGAGGVGAWEIATRYSCLDLDDAGIAGGTLRDITLGLNWYLNPNTRLMCNYVIAEHSLRGYTSILQFRFHVYF